MNEYEKDGLHCVQMSDDQWWAFPIDYEEQEREIRRQKFMKTPLYRISRFIFGVRGKNV